MPITPSKTAENTWNIKLCFRVNDELRCINEEFVGTIKEAMFHELQLREQVKDGSIDLVRFGH